MIGAGSSGLVTLKYLRDALPNAELLCFEGGDSVRGCWGNQRPDFVSTSTKYTTQFSCFRRWPATVGEHATAEEFFHGGEFGDYLDAFADRFGLRRSIRFGSRVQRLARSNDRWKLTVVCNDTQGIELCDAVFVCTGLAAQPVPFSGAPIPIAPDPEAVRGARVVVIGGGESATDIAAHLAKAEHGNEVYLSLRSGVRVSPRYHPIRGVPSDFLRNRLLLSFDREIRNRIGERFVTFRIRWKRLLGTLFPHRGASRRGTASTRSLRRDWDLKLKARAKDRLFNVFHNKSDDFLDAVAEQRLRIVGPAIDDRWNEYYDFDRAGTQRVEPDLLVWSGGYRSGLDELTGGTVAMRDFYHGCVHTSLPNLFLIGFARPIIGNIPSIAELQARYAAAVLAGAIRLPEDPMVVQAHAWEELRHAYPTIDVDNVYPVEQFPYCDTLAREIGIMPTAQSVGSRRLWRKLMLVPASTTHYVDEYFDANAIVQQKVYSPALVTALLRIIRARLALRRRLRRPSYRALRS